MWRMLAAGLVVALALTSGAARADDWRDVLERARGQTVYFNAWGGSTKANAYFAWVAEEVRARFGVELRHVKVTDIAETVTRIVAERTAGRSVGGSADLLWVNGENFASLKANGLLYGPFAGRLPHYRLVDTSGLPTTVDFTIPVEGMESPLAMARFVFLHDAAVIPDPPRTIPALLAWAKDNPGRFTYPQPPHFLGTTFLKQALLALTPAPALLREPPPDGPAFERATAPLWQWLDQLHPLLWRSGRLFPVSGPDQRRLLNDGEIDIAVAFSTLEAASGIDAGLLPSSARVYGLEGGTIGNASFVAIPFNASAREGAMVVADFLLTPAAQARKQDPRFWGADTVLDLGRLTPEEKALFDAIPRHPAAADPARLGPVLPEPHPGWVERIEAEWLRRYTRG